MKKGRTGFLEGPLTLVFLVVFPTQENSNSLLNLSQLLLYSTLYVECFVAVSTYFEKKEYTQVARNKEIA